VQKALPWRFRESQRARLSAGEPATGNLRERFGLEENALTLAGKPGAAERRIGPLPETRSSAGALSLRDAGRSPYLSESVTSSAAQRTLGPGGLFESRQAALASRSSPLEPIRLQASDLRQSAALQSAGGALALRAPLASATVPSLQSASVFASRTAPSPFRDYHWHRSYRPYRHGLHVGIGFHFGYPYAGYYGYYDPYCWPRFYVAYPFVGYYRYYGYPYFYHRGYAHCGFYDGFYVRFGYYRASYFSACSGFGIHAYHRHHFHSYHCPAHGIHYYHIRDCSLCYPSGSYVHHEVEVPHVHEEEYGPRTDAAPQPVEPEARPESGSDQAREVLQERPEPREAEELFFVSLKPAQLSFVLGLLHFRQAHYTEATESFYNASLEDPENRLIKVFLAGSLFAVGEYPFAAEYLRIGLEGWEEFPRYRWSFRSLYGEAEDYERQVALLEKHVELDPREPDGRLVLAFVHFSSGDFQRAAASLDALGSAGMPPADRQLAERLVREIEARRSAPEEAPAVAPGADDPTARFLSSLSLADVKALEMR
jgi:hypothetical protein